MRNLFLAVGLTIGLLSGLATAAEKAAAMAPQNTRELFNLCAVGKDNPTYEKKVYYCIAYIDGAVDYHDAMAEHKDMKRLICYPNDATLVKGAMAFIEWARANQGDMKLMNEAAVIGAVRGMKAKWPCK
jgi:hypothetical protein